MESDFLAIYVFISLFIANNLYADEIYRCTFGQQERVISINYQDQDEKCRAKYSILKIDKPKFYGKLMFKLVTAKIRPQNSFKNKLAGGGSVISQIHRQ